MTTSFEYLVGFEGTEVTLNSPPEPPFIVPETWEIVEKLEERSNFRDERDRADGFSPGYAVGKFLCRSVGSDAQKIAFMRIYKQIPTAGTLLLKFEVRAAQAAEAPDCKELIALKAFKEQGCSAVPELLGYQSGKQDDHDIVPGGYITYLVWEKVPGDSLDKETFWRSPSSKRKEIREEFRKVWEKLVRCGYRPLIPVPSKIIYDWNTGEMHISGFNRAVRINISEEQKWDDRIYTSYNLVLKSKTTDEFFPVAATDPEHDENGWRW